MLSSLGLSPSAVLLALGLLAVSPLSATAADVASPPSSTASSPFTRTTPVFVFAESPLLLSNAAVTRLRYYYQDEATAELITITAESGISQSVPSVLETVKVEDLNILPDGEAVMRRRDHAGMLRAGGMNCLDSTVTDVQISSLFFHGGPGAIIFLCPGSTILLSNPVYIFFANQTLATLGYPRGTTRAILRVTGSGQSVAIAASADGSDGLAVRNIQIDGNRAGLGYLKNGAALMEMGGVNTGQIIDNVKAYEPRGWSCLHAIEGTNLACRGMQITNNQIGPSGHAPSGAIQFRKRDSTGIYPGAQWADGISLACAGSYVANNVITDATDGGIVIFGAPGSTVTGNTIVANQRQLLGGINMVDYGPHFGSYTDVVVTKNTIIANTGFIKLGIAMGPLVWANNNYTDGRTYGGTVNDNLFQSGTNGYFGYSIGIGGHEQGDVYNNRLNHANYGGVPSQACFYPNPLPQPFVMDPYTTPGMLVSGDFLQKGLVILTCNGPGPILNAVAGSG